MNIIAIQEVWHQTSSDYQAIKKTRTAIFASTATLAEVIQWSAVSCLEAGQVILTVEEPARRET